MEKKYTILYIDDEESNLRVFKNTFRRDFNILLSTSADEGFSILNEQEIDVIITDQRMPGKTGIDLLKEIHGKYPDIPPHRLMVSGYTEPEDIETAYSSYGLFKFISKPWEAEELKKIILDVINMKYD